VDFLPAEILPAHSCVEASIPSTVPQLSGAGLRSGELQFFSSLNHLGRDTLLAPHRAHQKNKLEGLRQATFRRAGASPQVRRTVHPSSCYLERRLLGLDEGKVQFRWKDYRDNSRHKTMTLAAEEFIVGSCFTFSLKDFSVFATMASSPIATELRSLRYAGSSSKPRRPLPTLKSKKITVTGTKRSQACP